MCAVVVIVADVVSKQSFQMGFVQRNDVIQQISPAACNPPLCNPILPRAFERSSNQSQAHRACCDRKFETILSIPIEDQESPHRLKRERLSQLLDDPRTRGVACDIEMQDSPTVMADYKKNSRASRESPSEL
jgi:hypothetical protein